MTCPVCSPGIHAMPKTPAPGDVAIFACDTCGLRGAVAALGKGSMVICEVHPPDEFDGAEWKAILDGGEEFTVGAEGRFVGWVLAGLPNGASAEAASEEFCRRVAGRVSRELVYPGKPSHTLTLRIPPR